MGIPESTEQRPTCDGLCTEHLKFFLENNLLLSPVKDNLLVDGPSRCDTCAVFLILVQMQYLHLVIVIKLAQFYFIN